MQQATEPLRHQSIAVLLVTKDKEFATILHHLLRPNGYQVSLAPTAEVALSLASRAAFKLALIDRRHNVVSALRQDQTLRHIPMIGLQPQGEACTEEQMVEELAAGFDIVIESHRHREWLAIIKALLRRQELQAAPLREFRVHALSMNLDRHEVKVKGKSIQLTLKEFHILRALLQHPGRVLTRQELLNLVWGEDYALEEHALDVHIHALRQKLEDKPSVPQWILTVRGVGYKLSAD
ncbi:MAG: DNA-binding response regulator [Nitrospira sp.]|nr:response regulator transcription factor [Nitrospira sp.]ULA59092.1 MAG: DNA-binding response regulator [Nitrospira sp.]